MSSALEGGFLTTGPPGKSLEPVLLATEVCACLPEFSQIVQVDSCRLNGSPVAPVGPPDPPGSCPAGLVKPPLKRSRSAPDGGDEETQEQLQDQTAEGSSIEEEEKTDNATLLRLLEEGEKVLGFWTGGVTLSGLFPFCKTAEGYLSGSQRDISQPLQ